MHRISIRGIGGIKIAMTVSELIKNHLMKNLVLYVIVVLAFVIGICTGSFTVNALNQSQFVELSTYVEDFFSILSGQEINHTEILKISMMNHIKTVAILWLLGITVIGIPLIIFIIGIKGFVVGFSVGYFIKSLSLKGLLFSIVGIFPQNLIVIPSYIFLSVACISISISMIKSIIKTKYRQTDIKNQFVSYSMLTFIILIILIFGSIIESYITPVFIKSITSMFLV